MKVFAIFSMIFIVVNIRAQVSAINCYSCSNLFGGECENVSDTMIKQCGSSITSCVKITIKGKY